MKINESGKKAQAFSTESIFAYIIFLVIFATIVFLWDQTTGKISQSEHFFEVEDLAIIITENLIRTKGFPENWTKYDYLSDDADKIGVKVIGLAEESRVLDKEKVMAFIDMMNASNNNYTSHKWLLGLSKPKFRLEFYFEIADINGTIVNIDGKNCTTGKKPASDVDTIYKFPVTRTAILDDEIVKVKLVAWNPK